MGRACEDKVVEDGWYTTKVQTKEQVYDLGKQEYPPQHQHPGNGTCRGCLVVNSWTEAVEVG